MTEDAGSWAHHQPFGREQVLALEHRPRGRPVPGDQLQEPVEVVGNGQRHGVGAGEGALGHAGENATGPQLGKIGHAGGAERQQAVLPPHGARQLADSKLAHSPPWS